MKVVAFTLLAIPLLLSGFHVVQAADEQQPLKGQLLLLGANKLIAPAHWVRKTPRVGIIDYEFAVPGAERNEPDGRVTVMAAGGSVEANIQRWIGQFTQPDGSKSEDQAKVEKRTVAGRVVHLVDLSGTFADSRGPFAPAVKRSGYRMLAAIIETPRANYFVKFYGPAQTVEANAVTFRQMIDGMQ